VPEDILGESDEESRNSKRERERERERDREGGEPGRVGEGRAEPSNTAQETEEAKRNKPMRITAN
jgi:hypothetical protein